MTNSIQAHFNNEAINMLPRIKTEILKAEGSDRNNLITATLQRCLNASIPVAYMTSDELNRFQSKLLTSFKDIGWIN